MSWKEFFKPRPKKDKIDAKMWREIYWSKKKAREALVNLMIPSDDGGFARVKELTLANGSTIPVDECTEEQAHEFMKALCPSWAVK
jgi:hypothetical protein